jgi:hypothetical protein
VTIIIQDISDNNSNLTSSVLPLLVSPSAWKSRQSYKGLLSKKAKALIANSLISPEGEKTLAWILRSDRVEFGITSEKHNKA